MGRGLGDAGVRAVPTVKDSDVLGDGDLAGGFCELSEIGVKGAAVGVTELVP